MLLRDLNLYFAEGNVPEILDLLSDDIIWNIVGYKKLKGKSAFKEYLNAMSTKVEELESTKIVTHGKEAAVSGSMVLSNGKHYSFGDFYEFSSAKGSRIRYLQSFNIENSSV